MRLPLPKYFVVRSILEARLERNNRAGDRLPSESELGKEFNVSRITIQQALSLLEEHGLVERHRGRGTFYRGPSTRRRDTQPSRLLHSLIKAQPNGFTRLISVQTIRPAMRISERLQLGKGASVVAIDRVGIADSGPFLYIQSYLPEDIGSRLMHDEKRLTTATLTELAEEFCQVKVHSVVQTIAATLADPSYASHLGIDVGAPVLEAERTSHDPGGRPVIFSDAFFRADRHRFVMDLSAADFADLA